MAIALLAYIDPGSGTLLLQAAVAAILSGAISFRRQLWNLGTWPWRRWRSAPRD
ncbi:MAG: hypothetical protein AB7O62_04170 [Pirellulales bacterium]